MATPIRTVIERSSGSIFLSYDQDFQRVNPLLAYDNGFVFTVNAVPVVATTVTKVTNGLWFTFGSGFLNADVVQIAYSGVNLIDLTSTFLVPTFTAITVPGVWAVAPPLSSIIVNPITIVNNLVTATISTVLSVQDALIVPRFAVTFNQGGTFNGVLVPNLPIPILNGGSYSYVFNVPGSVQNASIAAQEWLNAMQSAIATALMNARLLNSSITYGTQTINPG